MRKYIIVTFLITLFFSCEKERLIDYDLPFEGEKLIAQVFLSEQYGVTAYLGHSLAPDDRMGEKKELDGNIYIFENQNFVDSLEYLGDGLFTSRPDFIVNPQSLYSIRARAEGYEEILSDAEPIIESLNFDTVIVSHPNDISTVIQFEFTDPNASITSAYNVRLTQYDKDGVQIVGSLNSELFNAFGLIVNTTFSDSKYKSFYDIRNIQKSVNHGDEEVEIAKIKLELIRFSPGLFRFLETTNYNEGNQYDPFTVTEPLYDNIQNGYGIFGTYAVASVEIDL